MLKSLQQALGGIKEVKVLGREQYFYEELLERQRQLLVLGYLGITLGSVPSLALQTVLLCGALALIAVLTVLGQTGTEALPVAGMFGYAGVRILPMANSIVSRINGVRGSRRAVDALIVVHDTETDTEAAGVYAFKGVLNRFRFRSDYRVFRPFTTIVSDEQPFVLTEAERVGLT